MNPNRAPRPGRQGRPDRQGQGPRPVRDDLAALPTGTPAPVLDSSVKVARDLREIRHIAGRVEAEAVAAGTRNQRLMPGGRAMVDLGRTSWPSEWGDRVAAAELAHLTGPNRCTRPNHTDCHYDDLAAADAGPDDEPALQTLMFWSERWRAATNSPLTGSDGTPRTPTIRTEASFLAWNLDWGRDNEPDWDHFCADIRRARVRVENLTHTGTRAQVSRVVCPRCIDDPDRDKSGPDPYLIRIHAPAVVVAHRCHACGTLTPPDHPTDTSDGDGDGDRGTVPLSHCPNPWCWTPVAPDKLRTDDPDGDRWKCPRCRHWYDRDAYKRAFADQLRHASADRYVTIGDALATLRTVGRPARTVRQWLEPPLTTVDKCRECGTVWPPGEHPACPRKLCPCGRPYGHRRNPHPDTLPMDCGGFLDPVTTGDPDAVVNSYCHIGTRTVRVWWPDLWRLHLRTQRRNRRRTPGTRGTGRADGAVRDHPAGPTPPRT